MNTTEKITLERLTCEYGYTGVVMRYGDKVVASRYEWRRDNTQGNVARIYRLAEQPIPGIGANARDFMECALTLEAEADELFEDTGHAIAWALANA